MIEKKAEDIIVERTYLGGYFGTYSSRWLSKPVVIDRESELVHDERLQEKQAILWRVAQRYLDDPARFKSDSGGKIYIKFRRGYREFREAAGLPSYHRNFSLTGKTLQDLRVYGRVGEISGGIEAVKRPGSKTLTTKSHTVDINLHVSFETQSSKLLYNALQEQSGRVGKPANFAQIFPFEMDQLSQSITGLSEQLLTSGVPRDARGRFAPYLQLQ